jgi:hypothetical protein
MSRRDPALEYINEAILERMLVCQGLRLRENVSPEEAVARLRYAYRALALLTRWEPAPAGTGSNFSQRIGRVIRRLATAQEAVDGADPQVLNAVQTGLKARGTDVDPERVARDLAALVSALRAVKAAHEALEFANRLLRRGGYAAVEIMAASCASILPVSDDPGQRACAARYRLPTSNTKTGGPAVRFVGTLLRRAGLEVPARTIVEVASAADWGRLPPPVELLPGEPLVRLAAWCLFAVGAGERVQLHDQPGSYGWRVLEAMGRLPPTDGGGG